MLRLARLSALATVLCVVSAGVLASTSLGDVVGKPTVSKPAAPEPKELLDPAEAFRPQVRVRDQWTAEVKFEIAPGYYLYRERLRVEGETRIQRGAKGSVSNQRMPLSAPEGRMVDDPTFGKVPIYEAAATVAVDLSKWPVANQSKTNTSSRVLVVVSQGCAAAGVCFPPQKHEFLLPEPAKASKSVAPSPWIAPSESVGLGFGASHRSTSPAAAPVKSAK